MLFLIDFTRGDGAADEGSLRGVTDGDVRFLSDSLRPEARSLALGGAGVDEPDGGASAPEATAAVRPDGCDGDIGRANTTQSRAADANSSTSSARSASEMSLSPSSRMSSCFHSCSRTWSDVTDDRGHLNKPKHAKASRRTGHGEGSYRDRSARVCEGGGTPEHALHNPGGVGGSELVVWARRGRQQLH